MVRTAGFSISASRFLGFIGFTDIREIFVEPTLATPRPRKKLCPLLIARPRVFDPTSEGKSINDQSEQHET
jgi:hypothetical protein